jgi:hypothetical protein
MHGEEETSRVELDELQDVEREANDRDDTFDGDRLERLTKGGGAADINDMMEAHLSQSPSSLAPVSLVPVIENVIGAEGFEAVCFVCG